jgi:hypothetical protein
MNRRGLLLTLVIHLLWHQYMSKKACSLTATFIILSGFTLFLVACARSNAKEASVSDTEALEE